MNEHVSYFGDRPVTSGLSAKYQYDLVPQTFNAGSISFYIQGKLQRFLSVVYSCCFGMWVCAASEALYLAPSFFVRAECSVRHEDNTSLDENELVAVENIIHSSLFDSIELQVCIA